MNELTPAEAGATGYEAQRAEERRRVAAAKSDRRVRLSPHLALVFENHETVLSAVRELVRAERLDGDTLVEETGAFAVAVPEDDELIGFVYLEAADAAELAELGARHRGVESALTLVVGDEAVAGTAIETGDQGAVADDQSDAAGMHQVSFRLTPSAVAALAAGASVTCVVDHPACAARIQLDAAQRAALAADLA